MCVGVRVGQPSRRRILRPSSGSLPSLCSVQRRRRLVQSALGRAGGGLAHAERGQVGRAEDELQARVCPSVEHEASPAPV